MNWKGREVALHTQTVLQLAEWRDRFEQWTDTLSHPHPLVEGPTPGITIGA